MAQRLPIRLASHDNADKRFDTIVHDVGRLARQMKVASKTKTYLKLAVGMGQDEMPGVRMLPCQQSGTGTFPVESGSRPLRIVLAHLRLRNVDLLDAVARSRTFHYNGGDIAEVLCVLHR
jgi:hypothetical protein